MSGGPNGDARWEWVPTFTWVVPQIAIGGSFPAERVPDLAVRHGIAAVVDLRHEACDDEDALRRHGLCFLHLPTVDLDAVTLDGLARGVAFANHHLECGRRVLIHCQHGIGRSATLGLCVLVSRGMAPLAALELAKARRPVVSPSPEQYEAWTGWMRAWARATGRPVEIPTFGEFKAIAYRHLET